MTKIDPEAIDLALHITNNCEYTLTTAEYRQKIMELIPIDKCNKDIAKQALLKIKNIIFNAQSEAIVNGGKSLEGVQLSELNKQRVVILNLLKEYNL